MTLFVHNWDLFHKLVDNSHNTILYLVIKNIFKQLKTTFSFFKTEKLTKTYNKNKMKVKITLIHSEL